MKIKIEGQEYHLDFEAFKKDQLFLEYQELLLHTSGIGGTNEYYEDAKKYILEKHPKFNELFKKNES